MAKRMQFSVVGLPHYTIWHLYEPSVDDIRHMEVSQILTLVFEIHAYSRLGNGSRAPG